MVKTGQPARLIVLLILRGLTKRSSISNVKLLQLWSADVVSGFNVLIQYAAPADGLQLHVLAFVMHHILIPDIKQLTPKQHTNSDSKQIYFAICIYSWNSGNSNTTSLPVSFL